MNFSKHNKYLKEDEIVMVIIKPDYYDEFHCIAGQCQHTCCASWEIDIDRNTYHYYSHIEGEFGDKLRKWIKPQEVPHFQMKHGMCPFLSKDHLCEVYQKLGEQAMCEVCTEYPRSYEEYGDTREMVLVLSCEEVGRILFSKQDIIIFNKQETTTSTQLDIIKLSQQETTALSEVAAAQDQNQDIESTTAQDQNQGIEVAAAQEDIDTKIVKELGRNDQQIIKARNYCIALLQDRTIPVKRRITYYLDFCRQVQEYIDSGKIDDLHIIQEKNQLHRSSTDITDRNQSGREFRDYQEQTDSIKTHKCFQHRMDIMMGMEVMEEEWNQESNNLMRAFYADSRAEEYISIQREFEVYYASHDYEYEHLLVYFTYRYITRAIEDHRFSDYAKFAVLCYLTIKDMDYMRYLIQGHSFTFEDRIENVRIFCKQVEHSKKSLTYLLEQIAAQQDDFHSILDV